MAALGQLVVALGLDAAEFVSGMSKSEYEARRFARNLQRDIDGAARFVKGALGTLAAVAGVDTFAGLVLDSNNATLALKDLAEGAGSTIESISGLERFMRLTNRQLSEAQPVLTKLTGALKDVDGKNTLSTVFKNLGLDVEELRRLDPVQALQTLAKALQGFNADGTRAGYVQQIFGERTAQVIPLLNDLAQADLKAADGIREAAEQAEKFDRNLAQLKTSAGDLARDLAGPVVASLNQVFEAFKKGPSADVAFLDRRAGILRGMEQTAAVQRALEETERRRAALIDQLPASSRRPANEGGGGLLSRQLPGLKDTTDGAKAQQQAVTEAARYLEGLQKQLQATQDLSVAETVLADIRAGRLGKVSADQQQALLGVAQQIDAAKRLQSQLQAEAQQERDLADQRRKLADEGRAVFEATRSPLEKLNVEYARLDRLLAEGAITWDTYARAVLDAAEASEKAAEKASATADDFTKRAAENFQDFLGQGLYDALSGNFKNIEQSFIGMVNRMIAEAAAADLARYLLGDLVKGGEGDGVVGSVVKAVLGGFGIGGKANGGPVGAGMYRVAENRPEMLDVNGKQFLLMGNQRGRIDPNPRLGGRGGVSVTNNFTVTGAVDRRTQRQLATEAGRAVQSALARNG